MIRQVNARIISNVNVSPGHFHCVLMAPEVAAISLPGQFIEIKVSEQTEPLLRRPFSVFKASASRVEILYAVVGSATAALSHTLAGRSVNIIGPLGNGFQCGNTENPKKALLVAGGIGVAPLVYLAKRLKGSDITVFLGAKDKKHLLCEKDFRRLGCKVLVATDDGSKGFCGRVTGLLEQEIAGVDGSQTAIYSCGPHPMLKEVAAISKRAGTRAWVSLEAHMACGIGACLGCSVNTVAGYKRVCKDGPVFDAREICWDEA